MLEVKGIGNKPLANSYWPMATKKATPGDGSENFIQEGLSRNWLFNCSFLFLDPGALTTAFALVVQFSPAYAAGFVQNN